MILKCMKTEGGQGEGKEALETEDPDVKIV